MHKQNHLAVQASSCVPHARELIFLSRTTQQPGWPATWFTFFFYFLIDYKHKHAASCGAHALNLPPPPSFLNRLQAQARPRPGFKHQAAEARATVIFLLTAWNIPYKRKLESYNVKKRRKKNSSRVNRDQKNAWI